jgi:hypothetical protein
VLLLLLLLLLQVSEYAASKRVVLKGDLPIGVDKRSVDTWMEVRGAAVQSLDPAACTGCAVHADHALSCIKHVLPGRPVWTGC